MKKSLIRFSAVMITVGVLFTNALAITWFPKEFTCPIDNQKNTFMVLGSFGSYIYDFPSKYQGLFFPDTASHTFYMCKKCHLTAHMWDYDELPADKLPALRKILENIKVSKAFEEYTEIPVTERIEVMEKLYSQLDKDDLWWGKFYRIKGYHYGQSGAVEKAREARQKALDYLTAELLKPESEMPRKILYYISGSVRHFLNDDEGARKDFKMGLETKYFDKNVDEETNADSEAGLNERLNDYLNKIGTENAPRLSETSDIDDH